MTRTRVQKCHRLCPCVYGQRPQHTEALPPPSLIISSSSSPKVLLFYIFPMWVECSYTGANSLCGCYVCAAKSKVKCPCQSKLKCLRGNVQFVSGTTCCLIHCPALAVSPLTWYNRLAAVVWGSGGEGMYPCWEVSDHLFRDSPHSFRPVDVEEGAVGGYKSWKRVTPDHTVFSRYAIAISSWHGARVQHTQFWLWRRLALCKVWVSWRARRFVSRHPLPHHCSCTPAVRLRVGEGGDTRKSWLFFWVGEEGLFLIVFTYQV